MTESVEDRAARRRQHHLIDRLLARQRVVVRTPDGLKVYQSNGDESEGHHHDDEHHRETSARVDRGRLGPRARMARCGAHAGDAGAADVRDASFRDPATPRDHRGPTIMTAR